VRTIQIRRTASTVPLPEVIERVRTRCQAALSLMDVDLLISSEVPGPVTARRAIILPENFLHETSEDVLTTAIGHEMAHVARHDFAGKLIYEFMSVPISFHPVAWLIRSRIEGTREIASDELVTRRLLDPAVYARSILSIAQGMTGLARPGYTLGVFDGDILEERIRRLRMQRGGNLKRARLLVVTSLAALAICAIAASTLGITARAQSGAYDLIKQGVASYNSGNYQEAVTQ